TNGQLEHLLRSRGWTPPTADTGAPEAADLGEGGGSSGAKAHASSPLYVQPRSETPATSQSPVPPNYLRAEFFAKVREREAEGHDGSGSGWGSWGEWGHP